MADAITSLVAYAPMAFIALTWGIASGAVVRYFLFHS